MKAKRKPTEQEKFWEEEYAKDYIQKNSQFDHDLGVKGWEIILSKVKKRIRTYLECGCNIGRNLTQIAKLVSHARPSIIEISKPAFESVVRNFSLDKSFNGPILEACFQENQFDLVFTMGVLIHVPPDDLLKTMEKMFRFSKRYVLMGEYFNRTPIMIEYQGKQNKLFKRDYGKLFLENFDCKLIDYGFLWGHLYDAGGFDDITWWIFEKKNISNGRPKKK